MPTSIRKNCDDSWVVPTEGPRGPKCTKSAGALTEWTKRVKWKSERKGSEYERRGSAEEYRNSGYEHWGSTRRVGRA